MSSRLAAIIALVLAAAVLIIFVSPLLDLPSTTLQQSQNHGARITLLGLLLHSVTALMLAAASCRVLPDCTLAAGPDSVLASTCVRRC